MENELKPCPFCGGEKPIVRHGKYMWWIECSEDACRASSGGKPRKNEAIEAWNRRAGDAEV